MLVFVWVTQFNGLYGQDSYEYLRYTKQLVGFVKTGVNPGDYFYPMLYPVIGTIISFLFSLPFALQLVSILSLIISAIYLYKILVLLYRTEKKSTMQYIFLFFLLSPYMLRGSIVVMSDSLAIVCVVASYYYFEQYIRTTVNKYFLELVFFFAAAISTRYAAFVVLIPFMLIAVAVFFKNFSEGLTWGKILTLLLSLGIIGIIFLPHLLIRSHLLFGFIHHEWLMTWSPFNFFLNQFNTSDGFSSYLFYNIIFVFFNVIHPAFCFAGIFLLISLKIMGGKNLNIPLIISVLLYSLFLAGIPFQNMRFLLLSFPFVLILLSQGYEYIRQILIVKRVWSYCLAGIVIIQLCLFYRVFIPFYNDNKIERNIAGRMLRYPKKTLLTFGIDQALKSYGFNGKILNMNELRMDTMKRLDTNLLVLFNPGIFSQTWKDRNPMLNWEFLTKENHLFKIEDLPGGWELFRRKS